jgi:hypothetical protein
MNQHESALNGWNHYSGVQEMSKKRLQALKSVQMLQNENC